MRCALKYVGRIMKIKMFGLFFFLSLIFKKKKSEVRKKQQVDEAFYSGKFL